MNTFIQKTFLGSILLTVCFFGSPHMAQAEIEECSTQDQIDDIGDTIDDAAFAKTEYDDALINNQPKIDANNAEIISYETSHEHISTLVNDEKTELAKLESAISQLENEIALDNGQITAKENQVLGILQDIHYLQSLPVLTPEQIKDLDALKSLETKLQKEIRDLRNGLPLKIDLLESQKERVDPINQTIAAYETQLKDLTDGIAKLNTDNAALQGEIDTAKNTYDSKMSEAQLALGMSGTPTTDELLAELSRQTAVWEGEDCDDDGTPNGKDYYPQDPTKNEKGSTGGIVPCGAVGTGEMCTLCHLIVGIHKIIKWGLGIMFVIAIVIITIAGIMYIVSTGNESMMQAAKKALMYALVGVAIMLLAWVIVTFVIGMLVGNTTGGVNTDENEIKYFSSYSCDGKESNPPTTTPPPSSTPAPTTVPTLPTP